MIGMQFRDLSRWLAYIESELLGPGEWSTPTPDLGTQLLWALAFEAVDLARFVARSVPADTGEPSLRCRNSGALTSVARASFEHAFVAAATVKLQLDGGVERLCSGATVTHLGLISRLETAILEENTDSQRMGLSAAAGGAPPFQIASLDWMCRQLVDHRRRAEDPGAAVLTSEEWKTHRKSVEPLAHYAWLSQVSHPSFAALGRWTEGKQVSYDGYAVLIAAVSATLASWSSATFSGALDRADKIADAAWSLGVPFDAYAWAVGEQRMPIGLTLCQ